MRAPKSICLAAVVACSFHSPGPALAFDAAAASVHDLKLGMTLEQVQTALKGQGHLSEEFGKKGRWKIETSSDQHPQYHEVLAIDLFGDKVISIAQYLRMDSGAARTFMDAAKSKFGKPDCVYISDSESGAGSISYGTAPRDPYCQTDFPLTVKSREDNSSTSASVFLADRARLVEQSKSEERSNQDQRNSDGQAIKGIFK